MISASTQFNTCTAAIYEGSSTQCYFCNFLIYNSHPSYIFPFLNGCHFCNLLSFILSGGKKPNMQGGTEGRRDEAWRTVEEEREALLWWMQLPRKGARGPPSVMRSGPGGFGRVSLLSRQEPDSISINPSFRITNWLSLQLEKKHGMSSRRGGGSSADST